MKKSNTEQKRKSLGFVIAYLVALLVICIIIPLGVGFAIYYGLQNFSVPEISNKIIFIAILIALVLFLIWKFRKKNTWHL